MRKELFSIAIAFCFFSCISGFAATTWNGSTWSNGAPDTDVDAIIASNVSPGPFACANLTINNGVLLTIENGDTVIVAGNLTTYYGGGVVGIGMLQFDNSGHTVQLLGDSLRIEVVLDVTEGTTLNTNNLLILGAGTKLTYGRLSGSAGLITGTVTVEKVLSSTNAGWRQISLPVNATVTDLNGINILTTDHENADDRNIFYWNSSAGAAAPVTGSYAVGWTTAANTDNDSRAYTVFSDNSHAGIHDVNSKISISGVLNLNNRVFPLSYTFDKESSGTNSAQRGWNFIPNPYAGNIDVYTMVNDGNFGTTYKAVHVYNEQSGQYFALNQSTVVNYNTPDRIGVSVTSRPKIMPFQGFWVKATSTSQNITLKKSFLSSDETTSSNVVAMRAPENLLRLDVSDEAGRGDQIVVIFDAGATEDLDGAIDMLKFKSPDNTVPTLYCREGDMDLCANALPLVNGTRSVQLMFETQKPDGTIYTFFPDLSAFEKNTLVQLEDRKTGRLHDFATGNYEFVYDISFGSDRFVLHFMQNNNETVSHQELALSQFN